MYALPVSLMSNNGPLPHSHLPLFLHDVDVEEYKLRNPLLRNSLDTHVTVSLLDPNLHFGSFIYHLNVRMAAVQLFFNGWHCNCFCGSGT
jgi:hypothetical protein